MSIENLILVGALCVTTAVNAMSALALRSLAQRLITGVIAYRTGRGADTHAEPLPPQEGRSPLQDVFQQYSKLTGRMADIIFQLTESRQGARDMVLVAARSIQQEASLVAAAQAPSLVAADLAGQHPAQAQTDRAPAERGQPDVVRSSGPAQQR